jgi:hypothetical protein
MYLDKINNNSASKNIVQYQKILVQYEKKMDEEYHPSVSTAIPLNLLS